jgi:hypothetical protein
MSTVQRTYQHINQGTFLLVDPNPPPRKTSKCLEWKVKEYLASHQYSSCREIAQHVKSSRETVRRILKYSLHLQNKYLRWIPHQLTIEQKRQRVAFSKQLLKILRQDESCQFKHILTGDESWIHFDNPHLRRWAKVDEEVEKIPNRTIASKKTMLVTFWGVADTPIFT